MAGMDTKEVSNDIDWEYQNKLRKEWLEKNPDAQYEGWMSI